MSQPNLAAALAAARAELADQVLNAPGDINRYVRWFESDSTEVCLDGLFNMEEVIKAAIEAAIIRADVSDELADKIHRARTAVGAELDTIGIEVELLRIAGSPHPEDDEGFRVRIVAALTAQAQAVMKGGSIHQMSRTWLPTEYQDEWVTPPRPTPNDWIERTDDGAFVLGRRDCGDGIAHGRVLRDGNVVKFDWAEPHGRGQVNFVFQDGQFVERQSTP